MVSSVGARISKTRKGTGHQTGSLLRGSLGSIFGSAEEHIANCIVSCDAVSIATTANLVVLKAVSHSMAIQAGVGIAVEGTPNQYLRQQ